MFKFLVVPLNLMFIFLLNAILSEDVKIEQEFPEGIASLGECEVAVTFEKGSIAGFAKYIQDVPKGVEIEAIETMGASFTFSQNAAKFIWMNVPKEEKFTIKYKLKVTDPYLDKIELGGMFSYLDKNKKMTFDAEKKTIAVGVDVPTKEDDPEPEPMATNATRTISDLGGNSYKMDITINKAGISGFAKVQDFIPSGAKVTANNENGAVFTVVDKKAKFVWMELPKGETFDISYTIDLSNASDKDPESVFGEFSYLNDQKTQSVEIKTNGSDTPNSSDDSQMMADSDNGDDSNNFQEVEQPKRATTTATRKQKLMNNVVPKMDKPVDGINYRVQILAGHKSVGAAYFDENHSYTGQFYVENHEGWVKYTTGNHGVYRQARDSRESITNSYNFPGPFVVAYNDGTRITVQEALMITNQKWLK